MNRISIAVPVYLYKKYAPWMLISYCILLLCLFAFSAVMPPAATAIASAIVLGLPIYVAVYPKSIFSIRSWDERKLTIGSDSISWDGKDMPVGSLANLEIYIFSFDNFKHTELGPRGRETTVIEAGDQNKLEFDFSGDSFDFTFYLASFEEYNTLVEIVAVWQASAVACSARSAFEDDFVRQEVKRWA